MIGKLLKRRVRTGEGGSIRSEEHTSELVTGGIAQ
ncbi:hypothetical protein X743_01825 [Mesorhizobium sp. LNHC252B00]|nr:hypothetical protein X743_01825 [Mesorhizobium sp. LNHC252B00]